ncbi:MAG: acetoacetate--CoA ligase [Chloroflexi bacterium]|nr:acetoacetate--CoA ligase [Chloroflexota bacterium]
MRWLAATRGLQFDAYDALWRWSIADLAGFWTSLVEFFDVAFQRPADAVLGTREMPGARWFEGARLNYAQNVFRNASADRPALVHQSETRPLSEVSWAEFERQVASVAHFLRSNGVRSGDRVVGYLPNIPEAAVAFVAAASVGAVWSSCSPDFGVDAVIDRFGQIEPKVLFAVDGYTYGGKPFSRLDLVSQLRERLPTLTHVVMVDYLVASKPPLPLGEAARSAGEGDVPGRSNATLTPALSQRERGPLTPALSQRERGPATHWSDLLLETPPPLVFEELPFDHPLWVVYSSGTTGLPKALVHGHGGIVLEHLKVLGLHQDLRPGDRLFWFSSTGWMMWNYILGGLLLGVTPVLFDGNPAYPDLGVLWQLAEASKMTVFGTSAAYIMNCLRAGLQPKTQFDLSRLKSIGSTGSPLPPEGFAWAYASVKDDLWLASISGGTDVASAFVGGCPLLPVRAGELQCRALGAAVDAFDEHGHSLVDQTGELVITEPMPSMPVFLWNDPDFSRYRAAYFEMYPGVWRHGDWIRITPAGSAVIQGRSDSTLNRLGVRIGTSEVYSAVESLPEIRDSLVIGLELPKGRYYMPLFVVVADGYALDAALEQKIKATIRGHFSPRHVPDEIVAVPAIPRTLSDKKMEVPVKKLFMGVPIENAANVGATRSPEAVEFFAQLARTSSPLLHGTGEVRQSQEGPPRHLA